MLKKRLIPVLLLQEGRMVKSRAFGAMRDVGHPVSAAKIYDAQGADELIFLDIAATREARPTSTEVIHTVAEQCFMPLTAGGGVRTVEDVGRLLRAGADKVAINTAAVEEPGLVGEAARRFGSQCVVVSIDVRRRERGWEVFTRAGQRATDLDAVAHARAMVGRGAGELLVTSIERDGTMQGYDLELAQAVVDAVDCPVIVSGGAGSLAHLAAVYATGAQAAAAASLFHFTDQSVIKAKSYLKQAGVDVRVDL